MALDLKYFKTHKQTHFNNEVFTGAGSYSGPCDGGSYRVDQELFVFMVPGPEKSGDGRL